ncbi:hypothetical protein [Bradyrhizobium sp.]|uniref:hypothetical protein n=1 Tax=Bradyrhizobium sp. TaxID=376 RepID=UPI003C675D43
MIANLGKLRLAATAAMIVTMMSMPGTASAGGAKSAHLRAPPPPPSWGYYARPPIVLDYALALSLGTHSIDDHPPYYTKFAYDYCDFRNCTLQRREVVGADGLRSFSWVPVWYGPYD